MEEQIKILQNLAGRTRLIAEDLETAVCSIDEQVAIRKLIARYEELKEAEEIERHNYQVAINETIPKSKVKEKIEELNDKDLEIYDTDSEDVIIAKYEDRAVLDFCNSLLED